MATQLRIRGLVQGVGFRPFVFRLATELGLAGDVRNDADGVLIRISGDTPAIETFAARLAAEAPPLARIVAIARAPWPEGRATTGFRILPTESGAARTGIVPDAALCPACATEIADPAARRHFYAFTNCTDYGPRFSIVLGIPYDRANTTMRGFRLCDACRAEYGNPADRRFHAQPIACPACGPRLWFRAAAGAEEHEAPIARARDLLLAGGILALKGLGGFHLACDARNDAAVATLRARKRRPAKPLALMAASLAAVTEVCAPDPVEARLLASPAAPILLLRRREGAVLAAGVAPGQARLGVMLPATPLHQLLLDAAGGAPLVMTSGNQSDEPPALENEEALDRLAGIADGFLLHDRPIARRLDDSVARVANGRARLLRRARGYAPAPLPLPPGFAAAPPTAAAGAELKSALCFAARGEAILTQHLGDLDAPLAAAAFGAAAADTEALFDRAPRQLACDLHPGYRATHWAEARAAREGLPLHRVQHHHAHAAAAMAEHLWPEDAGPVAAIVLDGIGLGADGTAWGGEILLCDYRDAVRAAHLRPVPLPGGDAAAREPWRNLLAQLDAAFGPGAWEERLRPTPAGTGLAARNLALLRQAMARGMNAPLSSSCGRLFDAMAALLGLCFERQSHEGEAGTALETLAAASNDPGAYAFGTQAGAARILDPAPMWEAAITDLLAGVPAAAIAARFHRGLAACLADTAAALARRAGVRAAALGGGVMQNALLLAALEQRLTAAGLIVLAPAMVPANDGGLAFGQAVIGMARALPAREPGWKEAFRPDGETGFPASRPEPATLP